MKKYIITGFSGLILIYLFILISGCGGGSSTFIPDYSVPAATPTSQSGTISGTITNALDGTPISGAEIKSNNQIIATSDNNGYYQFQGANGQLSISGGTTERNVYYSSVSPIKNISLIPNTINSDNYWAYFKWNNEQKIRNWKNKPNFVIYTYTIDNNNRVSPEIIDKTTSIIQNKLGHFLSYNPNIEIRDTQPQADPEVKINNNNFAYLTNGKVAISFINHLENSSGKGNSFIGDDGFLNGGGVTITTYGTTISKLDYILLHELGHAVMHWYHPFENSNNTEPSIMNYDPQYVDFTEMDMKIWKIQQKRPTGSYFPDNDPEGTESYSSKKMSIPGLKKQLEIIHSDCF